MSSRYTPMQCVIGYISPYLSIPPVLPTRAIRMNIITFTAIDIERNLLVQDVVREVPVQHFVPQPRGAFEYAKAFWRGFMAVVRDPSELGSQVAKGTAYAAGSLAFGGLVWLIKKCVAN